MELQLSLDFGNLADSISILNATRESIDIIELGTPLLFLEGIDSISKVKKLFPEKKILADLKIIDGGSYESKLAFSAGADLVTVLGMASNKTIQLAIETAEKFNKKVVIDLLGISQVGDRIKEIDALNADYVCVHTAIDDQQTKSIPLEDLLIAEKVSKKAGVCIAGGINLTNISQILPYYPDIIIVGSGITQQVDPAQAAFEMKKAINDTK